MPLFLYDFPNWPLGVLIAGIAVVFTLTMYFVFRRLHHGEFSDDERSLAMSVLGVVATINSLLIAFSAVSVWDSFGSVEAAVVQEADTTGQLARDFAVFDSQESRRARTLLREYAQLVVSAEWVDMREGKGNDNAWSKIDDLFRAVGTMEPDTPRHVALMPEVWARTNELLAHRRDRLYISQAEVPSTL